MRSKNSHMKLDLHSNHSRGSREPRPSAEVVVCEEIQADYRITLWD